jgi:hypothetical protein
MTVLVIKIVLQPELPLIRHNLLYEPGVKAANLRTVHIKVTLRRTVSRPVRLGVRRPSGTRDQFLFLLEIFFRHLRVYYFVAPTLTRGRVCMNYIYI